LYDPKQAFPQTSDKDSICYRVFRSGLATLKQREGGVTLSLASNGGEVEWVARDLLQVSTRDALKILNDEYLEIRDRYLGEFALMANAHAREEDCRPIVEEMIRRCGAKAIAVASSYGDGADRAFLDSPKAGNDCGSLPKRLTSWWHIHPPMTLIGHEALMEYSLNEAVGQPFDSTVKRRPDDRLRGVRSPPEAAAPSSSILSREPRRLQGEVGGFHRYFIGFGAGAQTALRQSRMTK
jgi:hypothetical protein